MLKNIKIYYLLYLTFYYSKKKTTPKEYQKNRKLTGIE